ncbi:hypothetical protein ACP4OV_014228 [Aristida adscensionis]
MPLLIETFPESALNEQAGKMFSRMHGMQGLHTGIQALESMAEQVQLQLVKLELCYFQFKYSTTSRPITAISENTSLALAALSTSASAAAKALGTNS